MLIMENDRCMIVHRLIHCDRSIDRVRESSEEEEEATHQIADQLNLG